MHYSLMGGPCPPSFPLTALLATHMTATDVSHTNLLPWNQYQDQQPADALKTIYEHANATCAAIRGWYWSSIAVKRRISWWVRGATFLLLIVGSLLPVAAGFSDASALRLQCTQSGVVALALAGLLQGADRIFGWSSGWLRYITTVVAIESRSRRFELEWAGYLLARHGALDDADVRNLFELARQYEDDTVRLQAEETSKWAAEFSTSMAALGDAIRAQRDASDKSLETVRLSVAAGRASGAIELSLSHKDGQVQTVDIGLDDEAPQPFTGTIWSCVNVTPGHHRLRLATRGTPSLSLDKAVSVQSDAITTVTMSLA